MPAGDVLIHEVLADEATRYQRQDEVFSGGVERARDVDLSLVRKGSALVVDRLPGLAAYPRQSGPARLFVLLPGQVGRYRVNFRFTVTQCACDPSWYYEDWLVHICHGETEVDGFVEREPDQNVDHRVHLYGGSRRTAGGSRPG